MKETFRLGVFHFSGARKPCEGDSAASDALSPQTRLRPGAPEEQLAFAKSTIAHLEHPFRFAQRDNLAYKAYGRSIHNTAEWTLYHEARARHKSHVHLND